MSGLQGQKLLSAFEAYYAAAQKMGRRKDTLEEIRFFTARFLKVLGNKTFTKDSSQGYLDLLSGTGLKNGRRWKERSIKNEKKHILKINRWLVKHGYMKDSFEPSDFIISKDDDDEINLIDLPSLEMARKIIILGTEPPPGCHKNHLISKNEQREAALFMLSTGMRIGELTKKNEKGEFVGLRGEDLMLDAETPSFKVCARTSKNRKAAILPLSRSEEVLDSLRKRVNNLRLFNVNESTMNEMLRRGSKLAVWRGKPITNHSLRHIFACHCAKNGMPIEELAKLMRHDSVEITNKYYLHYNVKELSISLHKHNDQMKNSLTNKQKIELIKHSVEKLEIQFREVNVTQKSDTEINLSIKI